MVAEGLITQAVANEGIKESQQTGQYFGAILVRNGQITREQLGKALAKQNEVNYVSLGKIHVDEDILTLLPEEFMLNNKVIPIAKDGGKLIVAMVEPNKRRVLDEISFMTGMRAQPVVTTAIEFSEAFDVFFRNKQKDYSGLFKEITDSFDADDDEALPEMDLLDDSNPLVKLVNSILDEAIEREASDIHIEPQRQNLRIRFRIDGVLINVLEVPENMVASFNTRLKVIAKMDIAEYRRPQDGRISYFNQNVEYNIRVNTLPVGGNREKIVLRILRSAGSIIDFPQLGFNDKDIKKLEALYKAPYGIVLA
ncbi:MAG: Flp pilus assembly complex ATPase component TadA, partial [Cyanobacteria bacterium HKST-UBA05]|nr:Flp pilus assembly complex ATPase component TadA [Cyanobacteria bacterium HKST-UBA05]